MTLQHPMFPPGADQEKCNSAIHFSGAPTAPLFTCAGAERVENGSSPEPFGKDAAEAAQGDGWVRVDISPEDLFKALGRLRREAEIAIERLIAIVDVIDGNSDLEADADGEPDADNEPSLGSAENPPNRAGHAVSRNLYRDKSGSQVDWSASNLDDREGDAGCDDREGDEEEHGGESEREDYELSGDEDEPSLGSFDGLANQEHGWRQSVGKGSDWITRRNEDFEADAAQ